MHEQQSQRLINATLPTWNAEKGPVQSKTVFLGKEDAMSKVMKATETCRPAAHLRKHPNLTCRTGAKNDHAEPSELDNNCPTSATPSRTSTRLHRKLPDSIQEYRLEYSVTSTSHDSDSTVPSLCSAEKHPKLWCRTGASSLGSHTGDPMTTGLLPLHPPELR